ncbi:hypothetical protein [Bartonella sp. AD13SXNS]|uniref:hypothetical protein n=1 Tax=Bartonella sp. AD13SXNS TaxID=3243462 RepID=UPI0035D12321
MGSGALGKGGRWQEGWVWICLGECGACWSPVGACVWVPVGVLRGENAFVMREKWSMLTRFTV